MNFFSSAVAICFLVCGSVISCDNTNKTNEESCDVQFTDEDEIPEPEQIPELDYTCMSCSGQGLVTCYRCNGNWQNQCPGCLGQGIHPFVNMVCPACNGTGVISCIICNGAGKHACWDCGGLGKIVPQPQQPPQHDDRDRGEGRKKSEYGYYDCPTCYGTGVCQTCGGDDIFNNPYEGGREYVCPNCRKSGKCSVCNGTGKKYGRL